MIALTRAAALGFAGGLRTFTPLAALGIRGGAFPGPAGRLVVAAAVGELWFDKVPQAPTRCAP